ncbi:hypothetical protein, conserved [Eimeria acervulina]|uniref:Uncharacterized protein n=1 Tax=Eimeria acervulina TaxID=5801 RepID=U6GVV9_EIMAC|nr:hypothetical protein, conserved [Eimeria acervulina]CDI83717.1 hypothetical protein, conserved [Eimeria acervulina]
MGPSSPSTEGPSPAAAAAMGSSSNSSNSSSSSSSSNSIPPLLHALASFDKAVGELCMETLHALPAATAAAATAAADATPAAAAPAAADATAAAPAAECEGPQLGQQLPSVEAFEERLSLERRLKNLKTAAENSRKNTQSHKPLVQRLKAELECLDSALKQVLEREEALKQGMPFAACSS